MQLHQSHTLWPEIVLLSACLSGKIIFPIIHILDYLSLLYKQKAYIIENFTHIHCKDTLSISCQSRIIMKTNLNNWDIEIWEVQCHSSLSTLLRPVRYVPLIVKLAFSESAVNSLCKYSFYSYSILWMVTRTSVGYNLRTS